MNIFKLEKVSGFNLTEVWAYVRVYIGLTTKKNKSLNSGKSIYQLLYSNLKKFYLAFSLSELVYLISLQWLFGKYETIIISDASQEKKIENAYRDKLFYGLLADMACSKSLALVRPNPDCFKSNSSVGAEKQVSFFVLPLLMRFASKLMKGNAFLEISKLEIDQALKKGANSYLHYCFLQKAIFRFLFKRWGTKRLFVSCHYVFHGIVVAAKELGIEVIEVQHGVITSEHFGYYSDLEVDSSYYPDELLSYNRNIKKNGLLISKVYALGSYYLTYCLKNSHSSSNYKDGAFICCTFQKAAWEEEALFNFLLDATNLQPELKFVLVPRDIIQADSLAKRIRKSNSPNLILERTLNFYDVVSHCDFHVTLYSTCALEAPFLGTPNLLFNYEGFAYKYYKELLSSDNTVYVNEIGEWPLKYAEVKKIAESKVEFSGPFEKKYTENAKKWIESKR